MNIEVNEVKYEIKSLIEFSSLAKLLLELSKRQKNIEKNILLINNSMNDKSNRLLTLENKVFGQTKQDKNNIHIIQSPNSYKHEITEQLQNKENTFDNFNEDINSQKENLNINNHNFNEDINDNDKNLDINLEKDNKDKKIYQQETNNNIDNLEIGNNIDNKKDSIEYLIENNENKESIIGEKEEHKQIKLEPELISKLVRKVNELEKKINSLNSQTTKDISPQIKSNLDNINNINNQMEKYNQNFDEISRKFLQFQEEFDKVKIKVEDFNIYDVFKGESGNGGNVDMNNALIQNLEKKIFKKFELYDEKNKKNEEDLFKNGENIKNIKGLVDNMKNIIQKNNDKIKENENIFNEYKNKMNQILEGLKNDINLLEQKIHKDVNKNNLDEKIKNLEEKLNKLFEKQRENLITASNKNKGNEQEVNKKFEELANLINEISKSMNHFEKEMNKKMNEENKILYNKISLLEKEIQLKSDSKDLVPINDKIYNLEENLKVINSNLESLHQYNEKFKTDINNIFIKLEYLDGEILQIKNEKDKTPTKKTTGLEMNNIINQSIFSQFKKEVNSKLEKLKTDLEHLANNFETISSSLDLCPSNKDFSKFQNSIVNLIEDLKSSFHKRYMERIEIQKALKLIDNQIKSLNESTKKYEGADNWLLAKKPIGNFMCASCESNIKNLEQKENFVAWNKLPSREDKTYRIGHGYSRILEMVNEEVIKNFENKDNKGYVSDDDKKSGNSISKSKNRSKLNDSTGLLEKKLVNLPKVNKKILNLTNNNLGNISKNKLDVSTSPYEITDPFRQDEPKITKVYKVNNKKNFEFFKPKMEKNNASNFNMGGINKSNNKEINKYMQMNLTMPDN